MKELEAKATQIASLEAELAALRAALAAEQKVRAQVEGELAAEQKVRADEKRAAEAMQDRLEAEVGRLEAMLAAACKHTREVESRTLMLAAAVESELTDRVAIVTELERLLAAEKDGRRADNEKAEAIQAQLNGEIASLKDDLVAAEQKRLELVQERQEEKSH